MSNVDGPSRMKTLFAGAIGNFVEWYDFALYGFFATTIAAQFFPETDGTTALLYTFSIFGVSFMARPLGAIAFGHLSDRIGRRPALSISVLLMSAGTVGIGLLPGYADIGATAAFLLLAARLLQGFSAGGESSSASVFVIEHAPEGRRGRYASYVLISVALGTVFGILVSLLMSSITNADQLASWGWRVPFIAAAPLALVGLYLRLRVHESPAFSELQTEGRLESAPIVQAFKVAKRPMLILIGFAMSNSVASYLVTSFLVAHLTTTAQFTQTQSLIVLLVAYVVLMCGSLVAGRAIDTLGRKRVAVGSAIGLGLWAVPTFIYLEHGTVIGACVFVGGLAFLLSFTSTTT
ncbi:MFS transporter, partial [Streptomyces sp. 110]